jgi:hypothetical protein
MGRERSLVGGEHSRLLHPNLASHTQPANDSLEIVEKALKSTAEDQARAARTARVRGNSFFHDPALQPSFAFSSPSVHFDEVDPFTVRLWTSIRGPKMFVHVMDTKSGLFVEDPERWNDHMQSRAGIVAIGLRHLLKDRSVTVLVPRPSDRVRSMHLHSRVLLVTGARAESLKTALRHKMASFYSLSAAFFPFGIAIPELAIRLTGFEPHTTEDDVKRIVLQSWSSTIGRYHICLALTFLLQADIEPQSATVTQWLAQVRVVKYACSSGATFSVFTDAPSPSAGRYTEFRRALLDAQYSDNSARGCGTGRPTYFTYCLACGSNDHPRGLCPFIRMAKWPGELPRSLPCDPPEGAAPGGQEVGGSYMGPAPI